MAYCTRAGKGMSRRFQTLIGTVKGGGNGYICSMTDTVSNPYRYGQRSRPRSCRRKVRTVSNPYRYGQRGTTEIIYAQAGERFKPL